MPLQSVASAAPGLQSLVRGSSSKVSAVPRPPFAWKTRIALPLALVLAVLALLGYAGRSALVAAIDVQVVPVVTRAGVEGSASDAATTPTRGDAIVQAAGWLEADPYPISVTALTDGVVKEVLVLEGQPVRANDVVARLVDDDARLALAQAEAELAERQAELKAAQRDWDHPIELDRDVATAESDVAEVKAQLEQLAANIRVEASRVAELEDQFARLEESYNAQAASPIEYAQTRLKLQTQKATLQATEAQRPVLEAQLQYHQALLQAAREQRELRIEQSRNLETASAAVAMATAARDAAKLRLDRTEVRATADGIAIDRMVAPGSNLMLDSDMPDSATVVKLYDPKQLQVRADVPLADAAKVGVGMPAEVVVDVLPNRTFKGVVTRIVQAADISKNTLQVKVAVENPAEALKPEMLARVRFFEKAPNASSDTNHATAGLSIFAPRALLHGEGDETIAWVVNRSNDTARKIQVKTGVQEQDGWVSVISGLHAGDQLISDPAGLTDGARIRVIGEAALARESQYGVH